MSIAQSHGQWGGSAEVSYAEKREGKSWYSEAMWVFLLMDRLSTVMSHIFNESGDGLQ